MEDLREIIEGQGRVWIHLSLFVTSRLKKDPRENLLRRENQLRQEIQMYRKTQSGGLVSQQ
jgi:hypothetical protein